MSQRTLDPIHVRVDNMDKIDWYDAIGQIVEVCRIVRQSWPVKIHLQEWMFKDYWNFRFPPESYHGIYRLDAHSKRGI